jgi:hypothetical protein
MTVAKNTEELLTSKGPKFPNREMHTGGDGAIKATSMTDGTTTVVQITLYGEPIGTGIAKRRKGDEHVPELGMGLALTRAFTDAATRYAATVDAMLNPEEDPQADAIRAFRRGNKRLRRYAKDVRRKAARERHRQVWGWDHAAPNAPWRRAVEEIHRAD